MEQSFTRALATGSEVDRSGAMHIAERAADILLHRAMAGEASSPEAFRHELLVTGWALIGMQTATAPLVNLVNDVLWKVEESDSPYRMRQAVVAATEAYKRQLRQHALLVAEGALALIGDGSLVVTISFSSTVQYALTYAQRAGRRFEVICAESLPGGEGRAAAELLTTCGVPTTLLSDAEAIAAIARADLVLVGADMLSGNGLVNKTGTRAMALAARAAGKAFYTLCGSEKFLPPGFSAPTRNHTPVNDSVAAVARDAHITELELDATSLSLLSGIVTEQGVLPVEGIEAWLAATKLHPALVGYMAEQSQ